MTKLLQALLTGLLFTFLLDAFIFVGIKINYIDFHHIPVYYNVLFADHQNIYIFTLFTLLIDFVITYVNNAKLSLIFVGSLFVLATATLIAPIGKMLGEMMLLQKDIFLKDKKYTYRGDSYYRGRKQITFYDYELKKVIILDKKRLLKD